MLRRLATLGTILLFLACAGPGTSSSEAFELVPLTNAQAADVAVLLERALDEPGGSPVRVVADERTNSLLVMGDPERLAHGKDLIRALDRQIY